MFAIDKNYVVRKSNYFIMNSSYDLSLEEQKIVLTLASMVRKDDEDFKPYEFKIADFMKLLGVSDKSKYIELPKITKELMKKVFEIEEDKRTIQISWLSSATYEKGSGKIQLEFSPKLKPYMLKLNGVFTKYKLVNILCMKSKYSPRIYEILKSNQFKKQKYVEIKVADLRKILKAENIYPKYADFKRFVLIQTQKELKKLSDLCFDFDEIKTGRKVTSIKFYIYPNNVKKNEEVANIDETLVTTLEDNNKKDKFIDEVRTIIKRITKQDISEKSATQLYINAGKHKEYGHSPLELIEEVASYSTRVKIKENFVGWLINTLKDYERPLKKEDTINPMKFNNFEAREYDYDALEKKLLGWDDDEEDNKEE